MANEVTGKYGAGINASAGSAEALDFISRHGPFDVLYTDPPWGNGILKHFQDQSPLSDKLTEKTLAFRLHLVITQHVTKYAFILIGNAYAGRIIKLLKPDVQHVEGLAVKYYLTDNEAKSGKPPFRDATLIFAEKHGARHLSEAEKAAGVAALDYDQIACFMKACGSPGKVLDCCAGFGRFLNVPKQLGWQVYGVEIGPVRFESLKEVVTGVENPLANNSYKSRT